MARWGAVGPECRAGPYVRRPTGGPCRSARGTYQGLRVSVAGRDRVCRSLPYVTPPPFLSPKSSVSVTPPEARRQPPAACKRWSHPALCVSAGAELTSSGAVCTPAPPRIARKTRFASYHRARVDWLSPPALMERGFRWQTESHQHVPLRRRREPARSDVDHPRPAGRSTAVIPPQPA